MTSLDNDKTKPTGFPRRIVCTKKRSEEMGIDPFCGCSQCKKLNRKQKKEEEEEKDAV